MSAPKADNNVVGIQSHPTNRTRAMLHHVPVNRINRAPHDFRARIAKERHTWIFLDSLICRERTAHVRAICHEHGRIRSCLAHRTAMMTTKKYTAKEHRANNALSQEKSLMDWSCQYNGPSAVHRLSHRHAAMASVQRAMEPKDGMRPVACVALEICGVLIV